MKDRGQPDIGAANPFQVWTSIQWKLVKKRVKNLRQRIHRVTQNQQWNRVRSLIKLMLRSYSNLLLAMRQVTQETRGKSTPGIDGQVALTTVQQVKIPSKLFILNSCFDCTSSWAEAFMAKGAVRIVAGSEILDRLQGSNAISFDL
ncbi:MAG TPA: reverse transcriptase N-terminal domain-containing protein [Allocoleopsis sp.]